jgi:hypothetical protein
MQKLSDAQEMDLMATPESRVVADDQVPAFRVNTLPFWSPTAQKLTVGHDAAFIDSIESSVDEPDHDPGVVDEAH